MTNLVGTKLGMIPAMSASTSAWLTIGPSHPLRALDRPLAVLWLIATALGAGTLAAGARRLARARRGWQPLGDAAGVVVAESYGPAVVGVRRSTIVLPRWTLALPADDLALVLAHERAHLRARDPMLLAAALAALVALPWLLPLWLVVARLRVAVERDCDRRVTRRHPDVLRYGRLLVDVAERALPPVPRWSVARVAGGVTGAAALLDPPGTLEARIRSLLAPAPDRGARLRATGLVAVAAGAASLACVAPGPRRGAGDEARPTPSASAAAASITPAPTPAPSTDASQRATIDSLRAQVAVLRARLDETAARAERAARYHARAHRGGRLPHLPIAA